MNWGSKCELTFSLLMLLRCSLESATCLCSIHGLGAQVSTSYQMKQLQQEPQRGSLVL